MKPLTYYTDQIDQVEAIASDYGSNLEGLDIAQLREVQGCLAMWLTYDFPSFYMGNTPDMDMSNEVYGVVAMLDGISQRTAQQLIEAISTYLSQRMLEAG